MHFGSLMITMHSLESPTGGTHDPKATLMIMNQTLSAACFSSIRNLVYKKSALSSDSIVRLLNQKLWHILYTKHVKINFWNMLLRKIYVHKYPKSIFWPNTKMPLMFLMARSQDALSPSWIIATPSLLFRNFTWSNKFGTKFFRTQKINPRPLNYQIKMEI